MYNKPMTKNLKKQKEETVTENVGVMTDDDVASLPHKAIGIFLNEKTNSWEVALIDFDGNTGKARVSSKHGFQHDDKAIAIERFKIMAIQEGVI